MNGFACGPILTPPPAAPDGAPIVNDGWFPNVDPVDLRKARRIPGDMPAERLRDAVREAMIWANDQLEGWRAMQTAASFAEVPSPPLDGATRNIVLYQLAVGAWTKALLVERQRDVDLTGAGQRKVEELDASVGELRRDALHAVRGILGQTRTNVELL
ncbi:head completion/stabilization protein [Sphingomonas elodea]|uniref:head completion/stabilization protein n=1 Tax=Sphingomonas elodea TaxID=179878 RepID=UPI0002631712|nr:head completion/stabilization protein [Sphingomonas elodea]